CPVQDRSRSATSNAPAAIRVFLPAPPGVDREMTVGSHLEVVLVRGAFQPEQKMLSLVLTVLILIIVYFLQQGNPFLAGILAVAPVKIVAASLITFEDGGIERLHEAISGMLSGQVVWGAALLVAWFMLR